MSGIFRQHGHTYEPSLAEIGRETAHLIGSLLLENVVLVSSGATDN